jgi:hypothetical protein
LLAFLVAVAVTDRTGPAGFSVRAAIAAPLYWAGAISGDTFNAVMLP